MSWPGWNCTVDARQVKLTQAQRRLVDAKMPPIPDKEITSTPFRCGLSSWSWIHDAKTRGVTGVFVVRGKHKFYFHSYEEALFWLKAWSHRSRGRDSTERRAFQKHGRGLERGWHNGALWSRIPLRYRNMPFREGMAVVRLALVAFLVRGKR